MKIEKTSENGLNSTYNIVIPNKDLSEKVEKTLEEKAKKVKMPGFRPGKAPVKMIREKYIHDTMMKISDSFIQTAHSKILSENKIIPAKKTDVDIKKLDEKEDFQFELKIEAMPKIELKDISNISIENPVVSINEKDVTDTLEKIRKEVKVFKDAKTGALINAGDKVKISLEVIENGEIVANQSDEDLEIHAQIIPEGERVGDYFDEACEKIIGKKDGDNVSFDTFYKKYSKKSKEGKKTDVICNISIKSHKKPTEANLDDEMAKELKFDSLEDLTKRIREDFEQRNKQYAHMYVKRHLLDNLSDIYEFDLPESMVNAEFENIWSKVQEEIKQNPDSSEGKSEDELKDDYKKIAQRRVKLGLIISEVSRTEKISLSNEEVYAEVERSARQFNMPIENAVKFFRENPKYLENITAPAMEEKVVAKLVDKVNLSEKKMNFDEFKKIAKDIVPMEDDSDKADEKNAEESK